MRDFDTVRLYCLALEIFNQLSGLTVFSALEAATDPIGESSLKDFRPVHTLSAGKREAKFQRMDRWSDGNSVAYYQAFCRNPETGKFERYAWRYMLLNDQLILHKTFPVTVQDWKD